jgi:hypothetical protein
MNFFRNLFSSSTATAVIRGGYSAVGKAGLQPKFAPVAFGGSVVAGVVAMMIGGYKVTDCLRYQQAQGQCDEVIEKNLPAMVAGIAVLAGGWGAFNTYNPKLHQSDSAPTLHGKELVLEEVPAVSSETLLANSNTEDAREKTVESVEPVYEMEPQSERKTRMEKAEEMKILHQSGYSQREIAEAFKVSRYAVRKALGENEKVRNQEDSRASGRNADRGR